MHFKRRLAAPSWKVLLFSPVSSYLRSRLPWQHQKTSHPVWRPWGTAPASAGLGKGLAHAAPRQHWELLPPCLAAPGLGRQRRTSSRHSFKLCQSLHPTAATSVFLLFRSRTYLLSKHFRCSLPRFLI